MDQDFTLNFKVGTSDAVQGLNDIKNAADQAAESVGKIGENAEEAASKVNNVGETVDQNISKVEGLGSAFENVFQNSIQDAQKLGGTLGDVFKGVKQSIPVVKQLNSTALAGLTGIKAALAGLGIGVIVTAISLLVSKIVETVKSTRELQKAERDLNLEIKKGTSEAAGQIVKLKELASRYRELGDSANAKKQFLVDFADEIKQTGLNVTDLNTAEEVFVNNTDTYIKGLELRAQATAAYNLAVKTYEEYLETLPEKQEAVTEASEKKNRSVWQKIWGSIVQGSVQGAQGGAEAASAVVSEQVKKNVEKAQKEVDEYETRMKGRFQELLNQYTKLSEEADAFLGSARVKGGGGGKGIPTAQEIYDLWAKENPELVLKGELAVRAWEKQIEKEGKMAAELARLRELLSQPVAVKEEDVDELSPKEYLTKIHERRQAEFEAQKELLDIQVLSAREKNNQLFNIELERLDEEKIFLQQQYDLELEGSEKKEEIAQRIAENERQRAIVEHQQLEERKKDLAEEVQAYADAATSIASIFGIAAQAREEDIRRRVEEGKISEEQAEKEFETVKNWQLAENWINTAAGITRALTGITTSLGPAGWIPQAAQAAALLANGIAQDRRIRATQFGSGATGGGGVSAPSVGVTPLQVTDDIQVSPSALAQSQSPADQRVYILESDLQESDRRVEIREANTSF